MLNEIRKTPPTHIFITYLLLGIALGTILANSLAQDPGQTFNYYQSMLPASGIFLLFGSAMYQSDKKIIESTGNFTANFGTSMLGFCASIMTQTA